MEKPNLSYINSLSAGDVTFKQKLIDIIKKEFPLEKDEYYKNLKDKNYKLVAENVHKLKHKISILGLEESYEIAVEYENNLKEKNTKLEKEFESILKNITKYLNQMT